MKVKAKTESGKAKVAVPAEDSQSEGALRYIPLELLVDHDELPNRKLIKEHVAGLKSSIRDHGLDVPLAAWDGGEEGIEMEVEGLKGTHPASFLVFGGHRREGLRQLSKEDNAWFKKTFPNGIPTMMRSGDLKDVVAAQLRENVQRENPEPEDVLPHVQRLRDEFKMKNSEIAKAIGKSKAWVGTVLDIEEQLGKEALEDVKSKKIKLTDAVEAAQDAKRKGKAGIKVNKKKVVAKLKAKVGGKTASGKDRKRAAKTMSAKSIYKAYHAMPTMGMAKKVPILEAALAYLAGESTKVPKELQSDEE